MSDGTPLRKYGKYRVRQIKRRTPFFELCDETCDDLDAAVVARSYCKASVEFVGERLGSGRMLATPREYAEAVVTQFAHWHKSRFSHVRQAWLVGSLGVHWINGGPVSDCNTDTYSPAGRAWQNEKSEGVRRDVLACCGDNTEMQSIHRRLWEETDASDDGIVQRFYQ